MRFANLLRIVVSHKFSYATSAKIDGSSYSELCLFLSCFVRIVFLFDAMMDWMLGSSHVHRPRLIVDKVLLGRAPRDVVIVGSGIAIYASATWMCKSAVSIQLCYARGVCCAVIREIIVYATVSNDGRM